MKRIGQIALGLVAIVGVMFLLGKFAGKQIGYALFTRAVSHAIGRDVTTTLTDGLHVALCGSGSPLPDPTRAGPCVAVIAGDRIFVVDTGSGSAKNLLRMGIPPGKIDAIFLTHLHSDHIDGLGEMMLQRWIGDTNTKPVPIHGPAGVTRVVDGFDQAYALDSTYRLAHHGPSIAPLEGAGGTPVRFDLPSDERGNTLILIEEGDLRITAFRVDHDPVEPAVGYRFDYKDRSAVISGDTAESPSLIEASRGADVLFHEALQTKLVSIMNEEAASKGLRVAQQVTHDIPSYHCTPEQAAQAASAAGVKSLVLYHIVPPLPTRLLYPAFLGDAADYFKGPIVVGEDGYLVSLPAGRTTIETNALL